jgi:hypothetical protein
MSSAVMRIELLPVGYTRPVEQFSAAEPICDFAHLEGELTDGLV